MRKFISLGFLALIIALVSNPALADVSACDEVKKSKGLYGLCVAWHKADEKDKGAIAANYSRKSGGKDVPGSSPAFACPCWVGVVLADIGLVTEPQTCALNLPGSGDDMVFFGADPDQQDFVTNGEDCGYIANYVNLEGTHVVADSFREGLGAEGNICAAEMTQILDKYFNGGADCLIFP